MKPSYAPDNTRSSIVVIVLLAAAVSIVAVLLGLSEKPDVAAIAVSAADGDTASSPAATSAIQATAPVSGGFELDEAGDPILDEAGEPILDETTESAFSVAADDTTVDQTDAAGTAATTPIPIPTSTPAPTPEVAAAVEPTEADAAPAEVELDESLGVPALIRPGIVTGQFFTRPDEDEGATVSVNEITISLNEDGTGTFSGVLDMTLFDTAHVTLSMDGPIRWSSDTPQVVAEVTGSYAVDSPIDSDDITATTAELTISSLGSGSGSLCLPACFGFTFTPQSGL